MVNCCSLLFVIVGLAQYNAQFLHLRTMHHDQVLHSMLVYNPHFSVVVRFVFCSFWFGEEDEDGISLSLSFVEV